MLFWRVQFRALRTPAASALRRGQGLPPLSPLRSGQVSYEMPILTLSLSQRYTLMLPQSFQPLLIPLGAFREGVG